MTTTTKTNVLPGTGNGEIAFIDTSIAGYQTLLEGLREGVEAVLIDGAHDGVAQIAAALAGRSGIEAVHVFTHGAPGVLQLGATRLDEAGLAQHEADLAVLHRCAGCCWLFLDRSRGAGRRWCSMADCGTEAKKRRYVQRRRERRAQATARPSRGP